MRGHVHRQLMEAIWRCYNGREAKVVPVPMLLVVQRVTMGTKPRLF